MKKSFITALFLLTSAAALQAADDTTVTDNIVENVLINFGSSTGGGVKWNNEEGTQFESRTDYAWNQKGYGLKTDGLTNDKGDSVEGLNVKFDAGDSLFGANPVNTEKGTVAEDDLSVTTAGEMNKVWDIMHGSSLTPDILKTSWQQGKGLSLVPDFGNISIGGLHTGSTYTVSAVFSMGQNWAFADNIGSNGLVSLNHSGKVVTADQTFISSQYGTLKLTENGTIDWAALRDTKSFLMTWVFDVTSDNTTININLGGLVSIGVYASISAMGITRFDENVNVDDIVGEIEDNANMVPEPSTATLSLLALTALAARRRRK